MFLELHLAYWKISDSLIRLKKNLVDIVDGWNVRLNELINRKKDGDKKKEKPVDNNSEESAEHQDTSIVFEENHANSFNSKKIGSIDNSDSK